MYVADGTYPYINYTQNAYQAVNLLSEAIDVLSVNRENVCAERALFARYLLHVVGDIHQPLHGITLYNSTYRYGDIAGNKLTVKRIDGGETNLHSFWDMGAYLLQNDTFTHSRPMNSDTYKSLLKMAG